MPQIPAAVMNFAVITIKQPETLYAIVNEGEAAFVAHARERLGFTTVPTAECQRLYRQLVAVATRTAKEEGRWLGVH